MVLDDSTSSHTADSVAPRLEIPDLQGSDPRESQATFSSFHIATDSAAQALDGEKAHNGTSTTINTSAGSGDDSIDRLKLPQRTVKPQNSFERSSRRLQINTDITQLAQRITHASQSPSPTTPPRLLSAAPSSLSFAEFRRAFARGGRQATFQEFLDQSKPQLNPFSDEFSAYAWAKTLMQAKKTDPQRYPARSAGVAFQNLGAYGYSKGTDYQRTVLNNLYALKNIFGGGKKAQRKEILLNFNGVAQKGETCIVLGRPGR